MNREQTKLYNKIMGDVSRVVKKELYETSTGEFTGKRSRMLGMGKSDEYKKYEEDHAQIKKYREIAQNLFHAIDKFRPGQAAEMWNLVYRELGRDVRLGNIFGTSGKGDNAMTSLNRPADKAPWMYAMGWDGTSYVKDLDDVYTYTTGFGWSAKSGRNEDLVECGFDQIYSWLKTILYAVGDPKNGYQDFDDNTFYNCKEGKKIREKFGYKA